MHIILDEEMLSMCISTLSNDGTRLENLGSVNIEFHEILMAFGQTPFALNSAQISSPELIIHIKKGFKSSKDGTFSNAY